MARLTREQLKRIQQLGRDHERDAAQFVADPVQASALFSGLIAQIAAIDLANGVDVLERWAREKAAERPLRFRGRPRRRHAPGPR